MLLFFLATGVMVKSLLTIGDFPTMFLRNLGMEVELLLVSWLLHFSTCDLKIFDREQDGVKSPNRLERGIMEPGYSHLPFVALKSQFNLVLNYIKT